LLLLAALTVLGLLRVDTTGYELDADARRSPMASLRSVFFFAFYAFAVAGALAAVAHTQAGGDGTMTAVTFVGLVLVLALYDYLPWEPLRASDTGRPVRSRGIDRPDGQRP
jgi:hypothetical protein